MKNEELEKVLAIAEQWTKEPYDADTRAAVKAMIEAEDKTELIDSFYPINTEITCCSRAFTAASFRDFMPSAIS